MSVSVFEDKAAMPYDKMLAEALSKSNRLWQDIKKLMGINVNNF